ncbi:hypothetical protein A9R00_07845 [Oleispira antarctica]|uniref:TonB-dependent receptor plug domain-containing protein n=1 Tax=Oleispira antarctica TaxID=188908 RepID=A0A1Y5HYC4_OLEAN|nr:hypothetical protein A9R00_07845 [Oleispira antarctica]
MATNPKHLVISISLFFITSLLASISHAIDNLFDLSLKELLEMRIQVASKKEQSIQDSPGIITVITSKDLNYYGARNLHDAMRLVPAIQQMYPQFTHRSSVAIRGQAAGALDKYFLILLNGKPLRDPIFYGINAPIYEGIPLELIERLEIIRGPGSVIYGSNAFAGVMDIITKSPEDMPDNKVSQRLGSFGTSISEVYLNTVLNEQSNITAAFRNYDSDGWDLEFTDTGSNQDSFKNKNTSWGGFIEYKYEGFTANLFKAEVIEVATLSSGLISDVTERPNDKNFYSLSYDTEINNRWSLVTSFSENTSTVAGSTEYDANDSVLEIITQADLTDTHFDFGISLRQNRLVEPNGNEASNIYYKSFFAQSDFVLENNYRFISGIQVSTKKDSDIQYAPRLSLMGELDEHYRMKIMYGRAYSSPTGVELSLNIPGLFFGDEDLEPTIIDNIDLQLSYQSADTYSAINVFFSRQDKSIGLVEITDGSPLPKKFENLNSVDHIGFELEGRVAINSAMQFNGSYSFQTSQDSTGADNSSLLSEQMLKTGIIYGNKSGFNASLFNVYHTKPKNRTTIVNSFNPQEKAYSHLTININYILENAFMTDNDLALNLFIDNALNKDAVFLPDPTLSNLNTMPKVAGRAYYMAMTYSF